jgi:hypothetical protein
MKLCDRRLVRVPNCQKHLVSTLVNHGPRVYDLPYQRPANLLVVHGSNTHGGILVIAMCSLERI